MTALSRGVMARRAGTDERTDDGMTTYSDSTKMNKKDYQIEKLTAERDALQNEVARVKRIANANLGNGWTEQQRGNRYRNRALALLQMAQSQRATGRNWKHNYWQMHKRATAAETQLAAAQAEAGKLRGLLEELPKHIDQDYFYDEGFMSRVIAALAPGQAGTVAE